jgi:hypothetical protein
MDEMLDEIEYRRRRETSLTAKKPRAKPFGSFPGLAAA